MTVCHGAVWRIWGSSMDEARIQEIGQGDTPLDVGTPCSTTLLCEAAMPCIMLPSLTLQCHVRRPDRLCLMVKPLRPYSTDHHF